MPRVSQIAEGMQTVLTTIANALGREIGFIQRFRKLNGSVYAQTLVLGWRGLNPIILALIINHQSY